MSEQNNKPDVDIEKLNDRKKRDIEAKKQLARYKAMDPAERAKLEVKKKEFTEPASAKSDIANFWFHYKWLVIAIAFLIVVAVFCVMEIVKKDKYDLEFMYISSENYDHTVIEALSDDLSEYVEDYDNNSQKQVGITAVTNSDSMADANTAMANKTKLYASFSKGYHMVYFIDEDTYDYLTEEGASFYDLSEFSDSENIEQDKYYVSSNSAFSALSGLDNASSMIMVLRRLEDIPKNDKESVIEEYEHNVEFVKAILAND